MSFGNRRFAMCSMAVFVFAVIAADCCGAALGDQIFVDEDLYRKSADKEITARKAIFAKQDEALKKGTELAAKERFAEGIALFDAVKAELEKMAKEASSLIVQRRLQQLERDSLAIRDRWAQKVLKQASDAVAAGLYNKAIVEASRIQHIDRRYSVQAKKIIDDASRKLKAGEFRESTSLEVIDDKLADRQASINRLLGQAKVFFRNKKYAEARDCIEKLYLLDPVNYEAMEIMQMIYAKLYTYGIKRHNVEVAGIAAAAQWVGVEPVFIGNLDEPKDSGERVDAGLDSVWAHMERIIFPTFSFKDIPVTKLIEQLNRRNKDFDPDPAKQGVNIAFKSSSGTKIPTVSMDLANIPLSEIIRYVCADTGLKYRIEADGVVIGPQVDPMQERHFPVRRSLVEGIDSAVNGGGGAAADKADGGEGGPAAAPRASRSSRSSRSVHASRAPQAAGGGEGGGSESELGKLGEGADTKEFFNNVTRTKVNPVSSSTLETYFTQRGIEFKEGSSILYDHSRSRLTVRNTIDNLRKMEKLILQLDAIESPMILVEIRCIEVSENDFQELGFDWSINSGNRNIAGHSNSNGSWGVDQIDRTSPNQMIRSLEKVIANVGSGNLINQLDIFPALSGTSYPFGRDFSFNLSLTVNAICQNTRTETLSAPKLLAESGAKDAATIKLVKTIYFPDEWETIELENDNGAVDVTPPRPTFDEATDVGIIFSVRARANPDGRTINLQLDPQIINYIGNDPYDITIYGREISVESTTGDTVSYKETERNFHYQIWMPVFTERSLSVKVNVVDGCTLVLGGITQNQITTRVDKWPLLGDLPLIGRFFQSRAEVGTRNNMMMFVTARLINTKGVPREQNVEKGIPDFLR